MSGFASLLHQFKQTTQEIGAPPVSGNSISSKPLARSLYVSPSTPVKRIFIACPPIETGGPEALHQLCHVINSGGYPYANEEREDNSREVIAVDEFGREKKIGGTSDVKKHSVKAYMLYLKERNGTIAVAERSHRPAKYLHYDSPMAMDAPGKSGCSSGRDGYSSDLVVWPEIWTKYIDALQPDTTDQPYYGNNTYDKEKPKKYQIAIWWLSVDNNRGAFGPKDFRNRCDVLHLVQSYYARQYVTSNLIGNSSLQASGRAKVLDLTEFIPYANSNRTTLSERTEKGNMSQDVSIRPLDVVYNPAKGMHYTDEIIRRGTKKRAKIGTTAVAKSSIHFHPIGGGEGGKERISGEEVVALLKRAKVYIDFGHHPGMDRLPREAALAGCIVLTNREGAANFEKDMPLPNEFKFQSFDADIIFSTLRDICCDSVKCKENAMKMQKYTEWILGQEHRMRTCVDKLIDYIVTRRC